MHFGLSMFPTEYSMGVADLARAAEDHGFESLWLPEHTHIPVERRTPWPGGAELPREYTHSFDPFLSLAVAATVTSKLRLGTGVCLVIERDPITLAKEVATLDQLSGGRFLFGVGGGWNREEMANHGTDPARRWTVLRERVLAMKEIWTHDEAAYHGSTVQFDALWQWPKPVQRPHPPVIVGGNGPRTLQRVLEYGDGWMPIAGRAGPDIEERLEELSQLATAAERAPIPITIWAARPDEATLDHYRALGVERCVFSLPSDPADEILPRLARLAAAAQLAV